MHSIRLSLTYRTLRINVLLGAFALAFVPSARAEPVRIYAAASLARDIHAVLPGANPVASAARA